MVRTYLRTLFMSNENIQKFSVRIYLTKGVKWEDRHETEVIYNGGLCSWTTIDGEDGEIFEIIHDLDDSEKDECHEYLVLEFMNGQKVWYRNSHVSMFVR